MKKNNNLSNETHNKSFNRRQLNSGQKFKRKEENPSHVKINKTETIIKKNEGKFYERTGHTKRHPNKEQYLLNLEEPEDQGASTIVNKKKNNTF